MPITGSLARAARALVQWPRNHVARLAALDEAALADFEAGCGDPGGEAKARLRHALEEGGALFLPENGAGASAFASSSQRRTCARSTGSKAKAGRSAATTCEPGRA